MSKLFSKSNILTALSITVLIVGVGLLWYFNVWKLKFILIIFTLILLINLIRLVNEKYNHFNAKFENKNLSNKITVGDTTLYVIDAFLNPEECEEIIKTTRGKYKTSTVTRYTDDDHYRTSESLILNPENSVHNKLEIKISNFLEIPLKMAEITQSQYYKVGGQFKAHYDYFHPEDYELNVAGDGQRTWTCMIYLNDVEAGGETEFVELNKIISPKKGRAVIWNNRLKNGDVNPMTKHRGTPVIKGEKLITTTWFRDVSQR